MVDFQLDTHGVEVCFALAFQDPAHSFVHIRMLRYVLEFGLHGLVEIWIQRSLLDRIEPFQAGATLQHVPERVELAEGVLAFDLKLLLGSTLKVMP